MFDLTSTLPQDLSINSYQYHCYLPTIGSNYNSDGEFSIDVYPSTDLFHIHNSYIMFQGTIRYSKDKPLASDDDVTFSNLGPLHCFRLISYSLNGTAIESIYNPGMAVLMKTLAKNTTDNTILQCFEKDDSETLTIEANKGMETRYNYTTKNPKPPGSFSFLIPLKHIFAFVEDFDRALFGLRQTLKFVRRNDLDALCRGNVKAKTDCEVNFTKIALYQPLVRPSDANRLKLLGYVRSKERFPVRFHENSLETLVLPENKEITVNLGVRSSRPRYLLVGIQTDRHDSQVKNPCIFDSKKIRNIYATLNSDRFPSLDYNMDFDKFQFTRSYYDFAQFYNSYYMVDPSIVRSLLTPAEFQKIFPIFCIDLSRHGDNLTEKCLSMTLKLFFADAVPALTVIQVLIISERFLYLESNGESLNVIY